MKARKIINATISNPNIKFLTEKGTLYFCKMIKSPNIPKNVVIPICMEFEKKLSNKMFFRLSGLKK